MYYSTKMQTFSRTKHAFISRCSTARFDSTVQPKLPEQTWRWRWTNRKPFNYAYEVLIKKICLRDRIIYFSTFYCLTWARISADLTGQWSSDASDQRCTPDLTGQLTVSVSFRASISSLISASIARSHNLSRVSHRCPAVVKLFLRRMATEKRITWFFLDDKRTENTRR